MDRNRFNAEVRPYVTTIPIGRQGIAFDRRELDAWANKYIERFGRPAKHEVSTKFTSTQLSGGNKRPTKSSKNSTNKEEWDAAVARAKGRETTPSK